jgi:hypothetical protein
MAAPRGGCGAAGTGWPGGLGPGAHRWALSVTDIQKTLASPARVPSVLRGPWRLSVRSSASLRSLAGSR